MAGDRKQFVDNPYIPGVELWPYDEEPLRLVGADGKLVPSWMPAMLRALEARIEADPLATEAGPALFGKFISDITRAGAPLSPDVEAYIGQRLWTDDHRIGG